MISKSGARTFFLLGTLLCTAAFAALTIDTMRQIPEQSNADQITDAVKRGHIIWTDNNCMGCHTLMGEGAYYAPELTKVVERRGREWIRVFIKDPEAMFPGRRRMIKYDFTDAEIDDLLAFFEWIGRVDTNGFPADPPLARKQTPMGALKVADAPPVYRTFCTACHTLGGEGGQVGPALDGVAGRYDAATFDKWLSDPPSVKPGTAMPKLPLSLEDRQALAAFLLSDKNR
jgi:nitric oxide reductase subunit C